MISTGSGDTGGAEESRQVWTQSLEVILWLTQLNRELPEPGSPARFGWRQRPCISSGSLFVKCAEFSRPVC